MLEAFRVWKLSFKMSKEMVSLEKVRRVRRELELVPKAKFDLAKTRVSRTHPKLSPHFFLSSEQ